MKFDPKKNVCSLPASFIYNQTILKYNVHWQSRHAVLIFRGMLFFQWFIKTCAIFLEGITLHIMYKIFSLVKGSEIVYLNRQIFSITFTLTNANPGHSTAENNVISPNLLVWKFCGKVQFPKLCGNRAFPPFHKISTPGN